MAVLISKNKPSRLKSFGDVEIGRITAVPPKINPRLNIFDPMTLPILISDCPENAALIVTANSGADVPNATTVRPMIKSEIWNVCAISAAESTIQSAPFQSIMIDTRTSMQSKIILVSPMVNINHL